MAFIVSTEGVIFETGNLSGFKLVKKGEYYAATDRNDYEHYFEPSKINQLATAHLPVIPCTGEYMGLAAFVCDEGDPSESLHVEQAPVVAWQVDPLGTAYPITLQFHGGFEDVHRREVYRATDVLDVKSGKVYEVGSETVYGSLADYEAAKNEARAEAKKFKGTKRGNAAPKKLEGSAE